MLSSRHKAPSGKCHSSLAATKQWGNEFVYLNRGMSHVCVKEKQILCVVTPFSSGRTRDLERAYQFHVPIAVATRCKAWTIFARKKTVILGSNPPSHMDVWVGLFCVYVVLCVDSGVATGWSPVQEVLPTVCRLRNWKSCQGLQGLRCHRYIHFPHASSWRSA
jgi:hypothetical protein